MTPNFCTEEQTADRKRTVQNEAADQFYIEAYVKRHTLMWHTDSLMATAAILGVAPTLTSIAGAGIPALAGAVASSTNLHSAHTKRSTSPTKYLKSMTEYTLHIWPNGSVNGLKTSDNSSRKYAVLEFVTIYAILNLLPPSSNGPREHPKVEIKGVESKMWLCMDKSGRLYGSKHKTNDCQFHEEFDRHDGWDTYYSVKHPNNTEKSVKWYIALNRHGKTRVAMTTKHKSSRFKTEATQVRPNPRLPPGVEITTIANNIKYRRVSKPSRSGEKPKIRNNKPKNPHDSRLSDILNSIEQTLSKSANSNSSSFRDSLLIDLGTDNIFLNLETGDGIRHPTNKIKSKRRKAYRRKMSSNSRVQR